MAQSDIMIVDDNPANLRLLEDMLLEQGHDVRSFPLGRLALAAASQIPPDLILLDINMPEMNGYEVCDRLKSSQDLSHIPIIFLSALNETKDKVKAFRSGAVDYISKPFQFEEVHARVETHLNLHDLQRALKRQNEHLEEAVAARTRELASANQRLTILDRSKNEFLNLISHEFRTPLNGLLGAGDMILQRMPSTEETGILQEIFEESRRRMLSILDDALLLTEIDVNGEQFRSAQVSLHTALSCALARTTELAESRRVKLSPPAAARDLILADEELLVRALHALFDTAVRFSQEGQTVRMEWEPLTLTIEGYGNTIPAGAMEKFFDLFSIEEAGTPGGDMGLGPAVAFRILSLFGFSLGVENLDPPGIRLTVSLKKS